jgi:hypothetical protein
MTTAPGPHLDHDLGTRPAYCTANSLGLHCTQTRSPPAHAIKHSRTTHLAPQTLLLKIIFFSREISFVCALLRVRETNVTTRRCDDEV